MAYMIALASHCLRKSSRHLPPHLSLLHLLPLNLKLLPPPLPLKLKLLPLLLPLNLKLLPLLLPLNLKLLPPLLALNPKILPPLRPWCNGECAKTTLTMLCIALRRLTGTCCAL
jgi:hypothetical protein